jgi:hypothetical protein
MVYMGGVVRLKTEGGCMGLIGRNFGVGFGFFGIEFVGAK